MAKEQEKLYLELVEEVDIPYNGGTEFYEIIKNKKFKNTDEIRLFIQNYNVEDWGEDGGMAKYDLDFSITPDLVKRDEVGNEYVEIFINERNCDCRGRLYEDCTCEIYKGSRVRKVADRILKLGKNNITSLRDKLGIDYSSQELSRDYKIKSVGAFLHLCYGNNGNGWIDLKNANGDMIMIYREVDKHKVTNITDDNKLTRDDFYTDIQHLNIPDKYKDRTFITLEIPGKLTVNYYTDINKDKRIRVTYSNVKDMELKMYSNFEELVFDYVLNYYGISDEFNGLTKRSLNEFKELKSRWRLYGKDIS